MTDTFPISRATIFAVPHDRPRGDAVEPEDRDLGMIDQRRDEDAAEPAGARHGKGRVTELVSLQRSRSGGVGDPLDLGIDLGQGETVAATDDGHEQPGFGVDRDAEVVAVEQDDVVVLDPRVQLGEVCERGRRRLQHGGDEDGRGRPP